MLVDIAGISPSFTPKRQMIFYANYDIIIHNYDINNMRYWRISYKQSDPQDKETMHLFYLVNSRSDKISNSMQPRPIASRTMAPPFHLHYHHYPLQEVLGHGHPHH